MRDFLDDFIHSNLGITTLFVVIVCATIVIVARCGGSVAEADWCVMGVCAVFAVCMRFIKI